MSINFSKYFCVNFNFLTKSVASILNFFSVYLCKTDDLKSLQKYIIFNDFKNMLNRSSCILNPVVT